MIPAQPHPATSNRISDLPRPPAFGRDRRAMRRRRTCAGCKSSATSISRVGCIPLTHLAIRAGMPIMAGTGAITTLTNLVTLVAGRIFGPMVVPPSGMRSIIAGPQPLLHHRHHRHISRPRHRRPVQPSSRLRAPRLIVRHPPSSTPEASHATEGHATPLRRDMMITRRIMCLSRAAIGPPIGGMPSHVNGGLGLPTGGHSRLRPGPGHSHPKHGNNCPPAIRRSRDQRPPWSATCRSRRRDAGLHRPSHAALRLSKDVLPTASGRRAGKAPLAHPCPSAPSALWARSVPSDP